MKRLALKFLRHALTAVGGALVSQGVLEPGAADDFVAILTSPEALGAYSFVAGMAMSLWELRSKQGGGISSPGG